MKLFLNWLDVIFKNGRVAYCMERKYLNFARFLALAPILSYCVSMWMLTIKYEHVLNQLDKNIDPNSIQGWLALLIIIILGGFGFILSVVIFAPVILYVTYLLGKLSAEEARDIYFYSLYPARWFPGGWRPVFNVSF